jgi:hypothetical protein
MKQSFSDNEHAKRLLMGESCWSCQYCIRGSFKPKDWMCRNHQKSDILREEPNLDCPKELICDFYLRSGSSPMGVTRHIQKMAKKYEKR